jgi:hypothetical protein
VNKTTRRVRAGQLPPTTCIQTAEEIEDEHRRFNRGVAKCYAVALALVLAAIAYFV